MCTPLRPILIASLILAACSEPDTAFAPPLSDLTAAAFPDVIALPDGFWPEGIAFGRGSTFYVGSLATGAIWRGDAQTGEGRLLVSAQPGLEMVGMKYDPHGDRLVVAGGFTGQAFIYEAQTGELLATYALAEPGAALINDVVIAGNAAYFTDSFNPVIYRVPLGADRTLPDPGGVETLQLSGDFEFVPDAPIGNANGVAATPDGSRLIIVNTTTGKLYVVSPATGQSREIDLGGVLLMGDGILLMGRTLYVVRGDINSIAVVDLAADLASGEVAGYLTHPALQFPSTIANFGSSLYAVNARFDVAPGPDVAYSVVRVPRASSRLQRGAVRE